VVACTVQHSGKRRGEHRHLQGVRHVGRRNGQASVQKGGSARCLGRTTTLQASCPCWPRRDRCRPVEALQRGPRSTVGQARRSKLQRAVFANLVNDEDGKSYTLIWAQSRRCYRDCNGPAALRRPAVGSAKSPRRAQAAPPTMIAPTMAKASCQPPPSPPMRARPRTAW
jgi:hypothetical protein